MLERDYTRYDTLVSGSTPAPDPSEGTASGADHAASSPAPDPTAPCVYFVNMHAHPMDLAGITERLHLNIISFYVSDWDADLSPWPAKGLYKGDPDFRGDALTTLHVLERELIPAIEKAEGLAPRARAIAGYSMGGLFSAYAFLNSEYFQAMASLSGSLWFEGWPDYFERACSQGGADHAFDGRFAYFSIGSKERKSPPAILATVEDRNRHAAQRLEAAGARTEFVLGPGNHHQHIEQRCLRGLTALQDFFQI